MLSLLDYNLHACAMAVEPPESTSQVCFLLELERAQHSAELRQRAEAVIDLLPYGNHHSIATRLQLELDEPAMT